MVDNIVADRRSSLDKYLQAVLAFKRARDSKAGAASAVAVTAPALPVAGQSAAPALALGPPASLPAETFGCSRCRWAPSGCQDCSPAKATAWVAKRSKAAL